MDKEIDSEKAMYLADSLDTSEIPLTDLVDKIVTIEKSLLLSDLKARGGVELSVEEERSTDAFKIALDKYRGEIRERGERYKL